MVATLTLCPKVAARTKTPFEKIICRYRFITTYNTNLRHNKHSKRLSRYCQPLYWPLTSSRRGTLRFLLAQPQMNASILLFLSVSINPEPKPQQSYTACKSRRTAYAHSQRGSRQAVVIYEHVGGSKKCELLYPI